jgi:hypothetical protein
LRQEMSVSIILFFDIIESNTRLEDIKSEKGHQRDNEAFYWWTNNIRWVNKRN